MNWSASNISVQVGSRTLLHTLNLELHPGKVTAILGPNGSGKTTLLHVLAGLRTPQTGWVVSESTRNWKEIDWASRVAFVGSTIPESLDLSVEEVLASSQFAARGQWLVPDFALQDKMLLYLRELEVFPEGPQLGLKRSWSTLSAGEKQLVDIIRGLLQPVGVLILDEPTSALDLRHRLLVHRTLKQRAQKEGAVVAYSEHYWTDATVWIDDVVVLRSGQVFYQGSFHALETKDVLDKVWRVHWTGGEWVRVEDAGNRT